MAAEGDRAVGRHDVRQDQPLGVVQRDVATGGELDVHGVDAGVGSRVARPVLGVDDKSARGPAVEGIGQDQTAMGHLAGRGGQAHLVVGVQQGVGQGDVAAGAAGGEHDVATGTVGPQSRLDVAGDVADAAVAEGLDAGGDFDLGGGRGDRGLTTERDVSTRLNVD